MKGISWLLLLSPFVSSGQEQGVNWVQAKNFEEVKRIAKDQRKFIFVDLYATWCGPCKKMDKNVYSNDTVFQLANKEFVSIKIQMDKTDGDNDYVKSWYNEAKIIKEEYKPEGYPAYLFFSPEGKLTHREVGYVAPQKFAAILRNALNDPIGAYENAISQFKKGLFDYSQLGTLAIQVKKKDRPLAIEMAIKYKEKYLDSLSQDEAFAPSNLEFFSKFFYWVINSDDRYFRHFKNNGKLVDSLIKLKGISEFIVKNIIIKEEITDKLYLNELPLNIRPQWSKISKSIEKKFKNLIDIPLTVLEAKIEFYKKSQNWNLHFEYFIEKVETYGVRSLGLTYCNTISTSFKHCHDSIQLSKAITWMESRILSHDILHISTMKFSGLTDKFSETPFSPSNDFTNYAALLYNIGRKEEAIKWVGLSIKLWEIELGKNTENIFVQNMIKMKNSILDVMKRGEKIDDLQSYWFF